MERASSEIAIPIVDEGSTPTLARIGNTSGVSIGGIVKPGRRNTLHGVRPIFAIPLWLLLIIMAVVLRLTVPPQPHDESEVVKPS